MSAIDWTQSQNNTTTESTTVIIHDIHSINETNTQQVRNDLSCTVKPVYLEHVDNWFLKLVLYYFNKYIFKNYLSTCSR
jgi:hypothetical protein